MSDILQLVKERYTCKDYDETKKISAEDLKKVKEILLNVPTSSNTQTTKYLFINSSELKEKIATCSWESNHKRIVHSSQLIVFCGINRYFTEHMDAIYQQEKTDGRFDKFAGEENYCKNRINTYQQLALHEQLNHIDAQANIALGFFLLGIQGLGINATAMGGFTRGKVDQLLGLSEKGLHAVYLVSIGYSGNGDYNRGITKSRLPEDKVIFTLD